MGKEIVIASDSSETRIAIVENGRLAEMYIENPENERTLGDIYLGRVRRIMPSIQAAFVDIGQKSDAFLHFSDIADNLQDINSFLALKKPDVSKVELDTTHSRFVQRRKPHHETSDEYDESESDSGKGGKKSKIASNRKRGQRRSNQHRSVSKSGSSDDDDDGDERPRSESFLQRDKPIIVKIVKEPISAKGSRVSTDISLAGRFVVLVPLADYVAVSKKIQSYKERRRLRALATSLLPPGFGVIVRTVAEGKNAQSLDTDMSLLVEKWRKIEQKLSEGATPPALLHQDVNMVSSVIRDLFSDNYDRILIDDYKMYRNIKGYIQAVAPDMVPAVQLHKGEGGVFQAANIARDAAEAFERRVELPSGGYLIIEHTEAMHVIDVNSGRAGKGLSQEDNSLKVNLESARLVAQQLRLRDLGGIIVVDFIDLRHDRNRKKVFDELRKQFRKDRAVTKILPMSDFGLIQITRQRMRPSITTQISVVNGSPDDTSLEKSHLADREIRKETRKPRKVEPEEMIAKLDSWVKRYRTNGNREPLLLKVHPFTAAFLTKPTPSIPLRWFFKHRVRVKVSAEAGLDPGQYRFFDAKTGKNLSRGRSKFSKSRGKKGAPDAQKTDTAATEKSKTTRSPRSTDSKDGKTTGRRQPSNRRGSSRRGSSRKQDSTATKQSTSSSADRDTSKKDVSASSRDKQSRKGPDDSQQNKSRSNRSQRSQGGRSQGGRSQGGRSQRNRGDQSDRNQGEQSDRNQGGQSRRNQGERSDRNQGGQSDRNQGGQPQRDQSQRTQRGGGRRDGSQSTESGQGQKPVRNKQTDNRRENTSDTSAREHKESVEPRTDSDNGHPQANRHNAQSTNQQSAENTDTRKPRDETPNKNDASN
ncbi:MAG: Rne/Rng family ribonuclease [Rhodothermales bacterium]|nr:Rne/Rng family ribonuclease [Rhodothermales bacterium]